MPYLLASVDTPAAADLVTLAERAQQLNHDLRTPIGTVATALELLRASGTTFSNDDLETLDVLQRQVSKLKSLAETLRDLACDLETRSR